MAAPLALAVKGLQITFPDFDLHSDKHTPRRDPSSRPFCLLT